jgi:hypothetical protein
VATQDPSAQLFDTITSALLSSYEFSEITSTLGQVSFVCASRDAPDFHLYSPHFAHFGSFHCRSRAHSS